MRVSLLGLVYLIIGVVVASNKHYLGNVDTVREIVSAILAIVLWPLLLLGVNLHIKG